MDIKPLVKKYLKLKNNVNIFMKKYELLLTLPGTLDDNEVKQEIETVLGVVKEYSEGEVEKKSLGKVRLAYSVKQIRYGYYYTVVFEAEPGKIPELNQKLRLNKGLLRAIINIYNPAAKDITPIFSSTPVKTPRRGDLKEKVTLEEVLSEKSEEKKADKKIEEKVVKKVDSSTKKSTESSLDLNDIDKKLNNILEGNDVI